MMKNLDGTEEVLSTTTFYPYKILWKYDVEIGSQWSQTYSMTCDVPIYDDLDSDSLGLGIDVDYSIDTSTTSGTVVETTSILSYENVETDFDTYPNALKSITNMTYDCEDTMTVSYSMYGYTGTTTIDNSIAGTDTITSWKVDGLGTVLDLVQSERSKEGYSSIDYFDFPHHFINEGHYTYDFITGLSNSDHSDDTTTTTDPPAAPTIDVLVNGTRVTISWEAVDNANGYTFLFAPYPYTGADTIGSFDMGNETSISFDLWVGAQYLITVQASNDQGISDYSNVELFEIKQQSIGISDGLAGKIGIWEGEGQQLVQRGVNNLMLSMVIH